MAAQHVWKQSVFSRCWYPCEVLQYSLPLYFIFASQIQQSTVPLFINLSIRLWFIQTEKFPNGRTVWTHGGEKIVMPWLLYYHACGELAFWCALNKKTVSDRNCFGGQVSIHISQKKTSLCISAPLDRYNPNTYVPWYQCMSPICL